MDYLKVHIAPQTTYTWYGKIGDFIVSRNYEIIPNPGGNFLPINKGFYTEPMDVDFELFEPEIGGPWLSTIKDGWNVYYAELYLGRKSGLYTCKLYNLTINEKTFCKIIKGTSVLTTGNYYIMKGKFTAYYMSNMSK